jgi:hypothetical protein
MKRFLQVYLILVFISGISMAQVRPKIVFDHLKHDFGTFKEEAGMQTTTFAFTNKGEIPLILNDVRASCGCTIPEWTREPIAPGQNGAIKVSYNPKNRPGSFQKSITVQSNAETSVVRLEISGVVEPRERSLAELYPRKIGDLRVKLSTLSFSNIKSNETETRSMELVNDTNEPITVDFKRVPQHLQVKLSSNQVPPQGKTILTVTYNAQAKNTFGYETDRIYLTMNGSDDYRNSIGISANIVEDFSTLTQEELANAPVAEFNATNHDFGTIRQGEKVDYSFQLTNKGKRELIIRTIRASCGCTAVTPSKQVIPPGESVPVKVEFDSRGRRGRQNKTITIITNDPKSPSNILRISSNVETES